MDPLDSYFQAHTAWRENTRCAHRRGLDRLLAYFDGQGKHWSHARPADLDAFLQSLTWASHRGKLLSANSIDQALRVVRTFYTWAHACGLIRVNPAAHWKLGRPLQPEPVVLRWQDVQTLLNGPDLSSPGGQRDHVFLHLLYAAQLSLEQCRALQLDQVLAWQEPLDDGLRSSLERYVADGRPRLQRGFQASLLLTSAGTAYESTAGLRARLQHYRRLLGWPSLDVRMLHRSQRAHQRLATGRLRVAPDATL